MKGFASKATRLLREGVKRGCARAAMAVFRSQSYPLFGIPQGLLPQEKMTPTEIYPGAGCFTLSNGIATALGGSLTKKGELVTTYLKPIDGKLPHQHDLFRFSTKRFSPRIYRSRKPVVALTAGWQDAFYHWMYEVLPQIHLIEKGGHLLESVFAPARLPFQKESLELIGISYVIDAKEYDAVSAPEIIIASTPSAPTDWGCRFLRERLLPHVKPLPRKRLYVSRRDAGKRRVTNEEEVFALLKGYRFERIDLAALPFKEQMAHFASAEIVIGPHGAGLSHLVFCNPGTPFLEFFHPAYVNTCYQQLASVMGHPYYNLFGGGERSPDFVDPDLIIDLKKLEKILNDIDR